VAVEARPNLANPSDSELPTSSDQSNCCGNRGCRSFGRDMPASQEVEVEHAARRTVRKESVQQTAIS
jgi:hypothetical protein